MKIIVLHGEPQDKATFLDRMQKECIKQNISVDTNVIELLYNRELRDADIYYYFKFHDDEMVVGFDADIDENHTTICHQAYPNEDVTTLEIPSQEKVTTSALRSIADHLKLKQKSFLAMPAAFFQQAVSTTKEAANVVISTVMNPLNKNQ